VAAHRDGGGGRPLIPRASWACYRLRVATDRETPTDEEVEALEREIAEAEQRLDTLKWSIRAAAAEKGHTAESASGALLASVPARTYPVGFLYQDPRLEEVRPLPFVLGAALGAGIFALLALLMSAGR